MGGIIAGVCLLGRYLVVRLVVTEILFPVVACHRRAPSLFLFLPSIFSSSRYLSNSERSRFVDFAVEAGCYDLHPLNLLINNIHAGRMKAPVRLNA